LLVFAVKHDLQFKTFKGIQPSTILWSCLWSPLWEPIEKNLLETKPEKHGEF